MFQPCSSAEIWGDLNEGIQNKPVVLPAAEPSATKLGEDEAAPETSLEGGAKGSGETGVAGQKAGWKWAAPLAAR